jgi:hypothetical protein
VTHAEAKVIKSARLEFMKMLMDLSFSLTEGINAGRNLNENMNQEILKVGLSEFFNAAKINEILDRTLDRVAEGKRP